MERSTRFGASVSMAVAVLLAGCGPSELQPQPGLEDEIEARLRAALPALTWSSAPVLHMVWTLPEDPSASPMLDIGLSAPGSLPRELAARPLQPASVLARPGVYLEVIDAGRDLFYLAPLADPRLLRAESYAGGGGDAALRRVPNGAVAVRFPFVAGGTVSVFEVDTQGQVATAFFSVPLGTSPRGRGYTVPP